MHSGRNNSWRRFLDNYPAHLTVALGGPVVGAAERIAGEVNQDDYTLMRNTRLSELLATTHRRPLSLARQDSALSSAGVNKSRAFACRAATSVLVSLISAGSVCRSVFVAESVSDCGDVISAWNICLLTFV